MDRECNYSTQASSNSQARIEELEELVRRLSQNQAAALPVRYPSPVTSFPSTDAHSHRLYVRAIFLDSEISQYVSPPLIAPETAIPKEVSEAIGSRPEVELIITQYFETINTWMPIINRPRLERFMGVASADTRSDLALLLLAMRLIQHVPVHDDADQLHLYILAKRFCLTLELEGVYSLLKLQAHLLIAVYELGHGVLSAAYISVGSCARQGISLGINHNGAPKILPRARTWLDWEERQRVWWLILILDRYVYSSLP